MEKNNIKKEKIISNVYSSYLAAKPFFTDEKRDSVIRRPDLLIDELKKTAPENTVVITGSKGKGSLARLLCCALQTAGDCGLFISPHVIEFNERISVNFNSITDDELEKYIEWALSKASDCKVDCKKGEYVSPAGILALAAAEYYNDKKCGYRVFECGRGAKYDDVNRIPHKYAVIGTIFFEHSRQLGDTIEKIAGDKACVITEDTTIVYTMPQKPSVLEIIKKRAKDMGAKLVVAGEDYDVDDYDLSLVGAYQQLHASIAEHLAIDMIGDNSAARLQLIRAAMKDIKIPGRMELLSKDPFVFMDCAINRQSALEVKSYLKEKGIFGGDLIVCLPDDKDFVGVISELAPYFNKIFLSKIHHPHYPMKIDQGKLLAEAGIATISENDFKNAVKSALGDSTPIVIICANTFVNIIKDFV